MLTGCDDRACWTGGLNECVDRISQQGEYSSLVSHLELLPHPVMPWMTVTAQRSMCARILSRWASIGNSATVAVLVALLSGVVVVAVVALADVVARGRVVVAAVAAAVADVDDDIED